jgi:hypothetical protein
VLGCNLVLTLFLKWNATRKAALGGFLFFYKYGGAFQK